jgi:hypothetical protein
VQSLGATVKTKQGHASLNTKNSNQKLTGLVAQQTSQQNKLIKQKNDY